MQKQTISQLREKSRKLVRELGMLELSSAQSGRSSQHWHALIEISKQPGITVVALARLLLLSKSTLSRVVAKLVSDGLVKSKSGFDKRENFLSITKKGLSELKYIDHYSEVKIKGAFEFLSVGEQAEVIRAIEIYANALERSRIIRDNVKIHTLPAMRNIRKQIIAMIDNIQRNEFKLDVPDDVNINILKAEKYYYYNKSYNFWYATDGEGNIIGCIGLTKLDDEIAELKKFFIVKEYRGKDVSHKLMDVLLKAAQKHNFEAIVLGTINIFEPAIYFYKKYGFEKISKSKLPKAFINCSVDNVFMKLNLKVLLS